MSGRRAHERSPTGVAVVLLAFVSALALPGRAAAQAPDAGLDERVDARTLDLVRPALEAAARDSLPVGPLRAKVLEGSAKNRPPELIARVTHQLVDELRATRTALRDELPGEAISGEELVAASLARQQGVPMDAVVQLWSSRPAGTSLQIPVTVLAELVRRGVPVDGASALMRHVLSTGVPLERAAQIPGRFDGARGPDVAPPQALERALRDLNIPGPPAGRGPGRGAA